MKYSKFNVAKHVNNNMRSNRYINTVSLSSNVIGNGERKKKEGRAHYPLVAGKSWLALQKAISTEKTEKMLKLIRATS